MSTLHEKISALLRKAGSTTHQAEADLFMKKAQDLMERHQISMAELTAAERRDQDPMGTGVSNQYQPGSPASVRYYVLERVAMYFGCYVVLSSAYNPHKNQMREVVHYHGPQSARSTTELMFPFIWAQVRTLAAVHGGDRNGVRKLQRELSYALGYRLQALLNARRVDQHRSGRTDLVVLDTIAQETEEYAMSLYAGGVEEGKASKRKPPSQLARELAEQISIDPEVEGSKETVELLV